MFHAVIIHLFHSPLLDTSRGWVWITWDQQVCAIVMFQHVDDWLLIFIRAECMFIVNLFMGHSFKLHFPRVLILFASLGWQLYHQLFPTARCGGCALWNGNCFDGCQCHCFTWRRWLEVGCRMFIVIMRDRYAEGHGVGALMVCSVCDTCMVTRATCSTFMLFWVRLAKGHKAGLYEGKFGLCMLHIIWCGGEFFLFKLITHCTL